MIISPKEEALIGLWMLLQALLGDDKFDVTSYKWHYYMLRMNKRIFFTEVRRYES